MSRRLLHRVVVLPVAILVVVGCGGAGQVDTRDVERSLVSDFVVLDGVAVDGADCPNQVDRSMGGSFLCTVTVDGQDLSVRVVQIDDDGTMRFEQQQLVFEASQVADEVASEVGHELGQLVTATCGEATVIVVAEGGLIECEVVDESGSALAVVAEVGGEGVLSVEPALSG